MMTILIAVSLLLWGQSAARLSGEKDQKGKASSLRQHYNLGNQNEVDGRTIFSMSRKSRDLMDIQPRIVGGQESRQGDFPYFVDMTHCAGALIAPEVVLSAGHCGSYEGVDVLVSGLEFGATRGGAVMRGVINSTAHPNYEFRTLDNDLRLHRLSSAVDLDTNIVLKMNPDPMVPIPKQMLTVMGMGYLAEDGVRANILHDVDVQYIPTDACNNFLNDNLPDNMLCAGYAEGGQDACRGDSGAPLVIRNKNEHILVGTVSWGYGCARERRPGVYSRLSTGLPWIIEVVCKVWQVEASFCSDGAEVTEIEATIFPSDIDDALNSTDCIPLKIELVTDDRAHENKMSVVDLNALQDVITPDDTFNNIEILLNATTFQNTTEYSWDVCVNTWGLNDTCILFDFSDAGGDGLIKEGHLEVTWDDAIVYNGSDIRSGLSLKLGQGCET